MLLNYAATLFTVSSSDQAVLTYIAGQCVCPGYNFQLTCTAVGLGADATVWTINTTGADSCDDILLRHSEFSDPGGVSVEKSCRGRSIVGRSLSVDGNCYTSILDVTVGANLNGIIIGCEYDDGATFVRIGSYPVVLTTGQYMVYRTRLLIRLRCYNLANYDGIWTHPQATPIFSTKWAWGKARTH